MPTPVTARHNLHSVYMYSRPLGVECRACGHRALTFGDRLEGFKGNMRELRTLRFTCSACGSRSWKGWLFVGNEAEAWLEGLTVSPGGGGPTF